MWDVVVGLAAMGAFDSDSSSSSGGRSRGGGGGGVDNAYLADRQEEYMDNLLAETGTPEQKEYISKKRQREHEQWVESCKRDREERIYRQMCCSGTHVMGEEGFCKMESITPEEYEQYKTKWRR